MLKLAFSDKYLYELPEGHRFPIAKYILVKEQLLYRGEIVPEQLFDPGVCSEERILQVHTAAYWEKLKSLNLSAKELRRIGLPLSERSLLRARNSVAGTIAACLEALQKGVGMNVGGGTHHAYADHGEGFCILNDLAVAARYLLMEQRIGQVLVIDLDVHQGNGTAAIFQNEARVFTFSMHGQANYPLHKESSDKDIALPNGTSDRAYLEILNQELKSLFEEVKPEFVLYQAGVDVLETDTLGKLSLSKRGCQLRDELVLKSCRSADVPVVVTMGGGYSARLGDILDAHSNTFSTALHLYS